MKLTILPDGVDPSDPKQVTHPHSDPRVLSTSGLLRARVDDPQGHPHAKQGEEITLSFAQEAVFDMGGTRLHVVAPNVPALKLCAATRRVASAKQLLGQVRYTREFTDLDGNGPCKGILNDTELLFFEALEDLFAAVSLAFSSVEAWANSILPGKIVVPGRIEGDERHLKGEAAQRLLSLQDKLKVHLPQHFGVSHPFDKSAGQDFQRLTKLRNELEHVKTTGWLHTADGLSHLWAGVLSPDGKECVEIARTLMRHYYSARACPKWLEPHAFDHIVSAGRVKRPRSARAKKKGRKT